MNILTHCHHPQHLTVLYHIHFGGYGCIMLNRAVHAFVPSSQTDLLVDRVAAETCVRVCDVSVLSVVS